MLPPKCFLAIYFAGDGISSINENMGKTNTKNIPALKGTDPFLGGDFLFMDRSCWN